MYFYIAYIVIVFMLGVFARTAPRHIRYFFYAIFALITLIFIGLRYKTGGDWIQYEGYFNQMVGLSVSDIILELPHKGVLYLFLNKVVYILGGEYYFVNLIVVTVFIVGVSKSYKLAGDYWDFILMLSPYVIIIVLMSYNKQAMAIGFLLWAYHDYERGRKRSFYVLTTIAGGFHLSALLFYFYPFLSRLDNRGNFSSRGYKKLNLSLVILFLSVLVIGKYFLFDKLYVYLLEHYMQSNRGGVGGYYRAGYFILPLLILLVFSGKYKYYFNDYSKMVTVLLLPILLLPVLVLSPIIYDRIIIYIFPFQAVVASRVIKVQDGYGAFVMRLLLFFYVEVLMIGWLTFGNNSNNWLDYDNYIFYAF